MLTRYKAVEENVLTLREQLALFKARPLGKGNGFGKLHVENWDFADADTKIETHGMHSYPAMMIPQVARSLIHLYGDTGRTLLDPFCGSGTALVESKLAGLNSYGIDINPLALLLTRVKTTPLNVQELKKDSIRLCDNYLKILRDLDNTKSTNLVPNFFNIDYWFDPKVSKKLAILRSAIREIRSIEKREFFLVAFSQTVREVSYTRNGEFKLFRIPEADLVSHRPNVERIFFQRVEANLRMMAEFVNSADKKSFVRILDEDTRQKTSVPIGSVDLVVTSPPYGDSKTTVAYGQYSRLSLQWLDLPWERVKNIDSHSLGGRKNATILDNLSSTTLEQTLKEIQAIDKIRVKDVDSFFVDFQSCLKEIHRVCKKGATLCFVVGNRTVKGVKIPMDTIVAEMASELGFKYVETKHRNIPNKRMPSKNSPSNIEGELGETMTKEHIVILKKIP